MVDLNEFSPPWGDFGPEMNRLLNRLGHHFISIKCDADAAEQMLNAGIPICPAVWRLKDGTELIEKDGNTFVNSRSGELLKTVKHD